MREGEELKAPRHASAAATRDDHLSHSQHWQLFFCSCHLYIYKYRLTSVININPPHLLLPLQYKSHCPKICLLTLVLSYLKVISGHLVKATKALVISEPIAIFHAGHGKS